MEQEQIRLLLADLVGASGARFIAYATGVPSPEVWHKMDHAARLAVATQSLDSFLNAEMVQINEPGSSFAFDVSHCHFVSLCHELDRPALATLFCRADEVLFGDPQFGVELRRESTLASGGSACTFRLHWDGSRQAEE